MMGKGLTSVIAVFVLLIIGVPLVANIANETDEGVALDSSTNISLDVASARCIQTGDRCIGAGSLGNHTNVSRTITVLTGIGRTDADCALSSIELRNSSNGTIATTQYNVSYIETTGTVQLTLKNNTAGSVSALQPGSVSNTTWIDYTFCPTDYIIDGTSRTITALLPLFYVLMIFGIVALFVLKRYQEK